MNVSNILQRTEGGKRVILHLFPQSKPGFECKKNFKMRPDDKTPSGAVFKLNDGTWLLQDKAGADTKAKNAIQLVMESEKISFDDAVKWIYNRFCNEES